ncbi:MAG: hypothetical protein AAF533_09320 [Acidobacteriota bacterium]
MPIPEDELVVSLHRYHQLCDQLRNEHELRVRHRHGLARELRPDDWLDDVDGLLQDLRCLVHWLASLHVVAEGYREIKLHDDQIDELLTSSHADTLLRCRNSLFHFQKDYFDARFSELFRAGGEAMTWARDLHERLSEYLSSEIESRRGQ